MMDNPMVVSVLSRLGWAPRDSRLWGRLGLVPLGRCPWDKPE